MGKKCKGKGVEKVNADKVQSKYVVMKKFMSGNCPICRIKNRSHKSSKDTCDYFERRIKSILEGDRGLTVSSHNDQVDTEDPAVMVID